MRLIVVVEHGGHGSQDVGANAWAVLGNDVRAKHVVEASDRDFDLALRELDPLSWTLRLRRNSLLTEAALEVDGAEIAIV